MPFVRLGYGRYKKIAQKKKAPMRRRSNVTVLKRKKSSAFAQKVRNALKAVAEVKQVNTNPSSYGMNADNLTPGSPVDLTVALQDIATGNVDGGRIGNKVLLKRYDLVVNVTMNPSYISGATFRPGYFIMYVGRLRNDSAIPGLTDMNRLKQDGSGTVPLDNTVLSMLRNDNTDLFQIVRKKIFKLGGAGSPYPNNDFSIQKAFRLRNILKGEVRWNDGLQAVNKKLYMWAHWVCVDSTRLTISVPCIVEYYVDCRYIDV